MNPVKPHPTQIQSSDSEKFTDLQDELQQMSDRITSEKTKKTVVFYVGKIRKVDQEISLFVPIKGKASKAYVSLRNESSEDLNVELKNGSEETIALVQVEDSITFKEVDLDQDVDNETITAIINGEMGLDNVSICLDILTTRRDD